MKKIQVLVFTASMLLAGTSSFSKPVSPGKADEFRQALRAAADQAPDAIASMPKRRAHAARLSDLVRRAEQLFGGPLDPVFGSCVKAAMTMQAAWDDQMVLAARAAEPREIASLSRQQFEAGIEYWACRTAVDELSTKTRPAASHEPR
ncbi:MAG: hypothetical protein QM702_04395 [Rubrivivax sp.]